MTGKLNKIVIELYDDGEFDDMEYVYREYDKNGYFKEETKRACDFQEESPERIALDSIAEQSKMMVKMYSALMRAYDNRSNNKVDR